MAFTFGSLFSGIGGMDLGLERAGMQCAWQVEINEYCRRVLERHWPAVRRWDDVATFPCADAKGILRKRKGTDSDRLLLEEWGCDLIAGGFPCQPVSVAGRRQAERDPRWLWPHFARIVRLLRPRYVLIENVPGLLIAGHGGCSVFSDLAQMGLDAEWATLPASAFGAPHLRERVFIVAYREGVRCDQGRLSKRTREEHAKPLFNGIIASDSGSSESPERHNANVQRRRQRKAKQAGMGGRAVAHRDIHRPQARIYRAGREFQALPFPCWGTDQPGVARTLNGVSHRVDRIAGLGNAVVPQVAEFIGRLIMESANEPHHRP